MKYPAHIYHGLMFHHFHGLQHYQGQGSISRKQFEELLRFVSLKRILSPQEWVDKLQTGKLTSRDFCLTFDDGLLSQFDIALPVLEKYKLKAFWFIYSSVFQGGLGKFEIYRVFRSKFFKHPDDFYGVFFKKIFQSAFASRVRILIKKVNLKNYAKAFPFYSIGDMHYRIIRDRVLDPPEFEKIMDGLIKDYRADLKELSKNIWMSNKHLAYLSSNDHSIGMHSYSHPTSFVKLSRAEQKKEYDKNYEHIFKICGRPPMAMAHPVNSYNQDTLKILNQLGIKCGFCSVMLPPQKNGQPNPNRYEVARIDHAIVMRMMTKKK